ncbi:MAG: hypothetical protein JST00_24225 [Deltaproteobacteria bacterium]|nr:hypothetical protein [Deltaproteobacteria bacterium]
MVACQGEPEAPPPLPSGGEGDAPPASAPPARPSESDALSPATAEASAVAAQLAIGLDPSEASNLEVGRLLAVDWDGAPFVYLVFTAQDARVSEPLRFDSELEAAEGSASAPSPVGATTTIIGADATRGDVAFAAPNLKLLRKVRLAFDAAGGPAAGARLIAASPTSLFVTNTAGLTLEVETGQPVREDLVQKAKEQWASMHDSDDMRAVREASRTKWRLRLVGDGGEVEGSRPIVDIATVTRADGNLDLQRASKLVDLGGFARAISRSTTAADVAASAKQGFATTTNDKCWSWWFFGWHKACDTTEVGGFAKPATQQAHRAIQRRGNRVPKCGLLYSRVGSPGVDTDAWSGCGPAAATSLIWREWMSGEQFRALGGASRANAGAYDDWSYASGFEAAVTTPLIDDMLSCSSNRGTGTFHWDFVRGTNDWLRRSGSDLRLRDAWSLIGFHGLDANRKADLIHRTIGIEERPMVAAFDTAAWFQGLHFAPIAEYRITRHVNPLAGTDILIRGFDEGQSTQGWYSLSNPWNLASAIYWLDR